MKRFLLILAMFCIALPPVGAEPPQIDANGAPNSKTKSILGLKAAADGLFEIGVGTSLDAMKGAAETELVVREFGYLTPENCLKPAAVMPTLEAMNFDKPDAYFDYAKRHGLKVVGHCLVWAKDDRTPPWFFVEKNDDGTQRKATREELLKRMKLYIEFVVERYADRVDQWDVVNEVLADGPILYRKSGWLEAFGGPEFVVEAFKAAHAADPTATLIYNDYRCELDAKRRDLLTLIDYLQKKGTPVHAIGLQGHYELDEIPFADLETTLNEIRKRGLKVVISEVDIDVVKRGKWYAEDGKYRDELKSYNPYADGLPAELEKRQAEQYGRLFKLYAKHSDIIERVTFWGLQDGASWLNYFPWDRANYPLLFDRGLATKPAYDAVIDALLARQHELKGD